MGNETSLEIRDSMYVVSDTIINGNTYTHYSGTYMGIPSKRIFRDSNGYIVTSKGFIVFSTVTENDTTSYSESIGNNTKTYWISKKPSETVTTPARDFTVFDLEGHYYKGNETAFTSCDSVWIRHNMYDEKGGFEVLSQTYFLAQLQSDCIYKERRLIVAYVP